MHTEPIEAEFTRKIETKRELPLGWVAISPYWFADKKRRRLCHGRWFKITHCNRVIYRNLRFQLFLKRKSDNENDPEIIIDYIGWLHLLDYPEDTNVSAPLTIEPVKKWKVPFMALHHPEPTHRLAGQLAFVSVGLGMLSFGLGLLTVLP